MEKETIYTDEVAMLMQGATYTEVIAFMDAQEDRHEIDPFERMTKASPEHTVEEK